MFIDPIVGRFQEHAELVGLCDNSATRREFHQQRLVREYGGEPVKTYSDFETMLNAAKPDTVIVCTPDYSHDEFIIKSLKHGCDVISEKPLTTTAEKCQAIFDAVECSGKTVRTTFNLRWSPGVSKVREIIQSGTIGRVRHINFEYWLNTSHGADYFRRWHSQKDLSGGLLIHKSTHHFDLINWWLNAIPEKVFAFGDLVFYGKKNAIERGEESLTAYDRYTGATGAESDPFRLSLDEDETLTGLYKNAEFDSGYIRDRNVFRHDITIEDSMSVLVKYRTGEMLSYSLNAYCPVEGFRVTVSGDRGRIEYEERHASHIITGSKQVGDAEAIHTMRLTLQPLFSEPRMIDIPVQDGGHGGGDPLIQEQMFSPYPPVDSIGRNAGHEQGAASLLIGAAANLSIATAKPISINEIFDLKAEAKKLSDLS